jgi:hypothetical protein
MPIYQFLVQPSHAEPDVRWSYLPDSDAAKRYARVLINDFKSRRKFDGRSKMEIQDDAGKSIATIPFDDDAAG